MRTSRVQGGREVVKEKISSGGTIDWPSSDAMEAAVARHRLIGVGTSVASLDDARAWYGQYARERER